MTKAQATETAQAEVRKHGVSLAIVREGPHADEFAEFDADGESYGFCPVDAVSLLYKHGSVVATVKI